MWIISFLCLLFVACMCIVGTLSRTYDDNLAQRVGMALICFGVLAWANAVWEAGGVSPVSFMAHIGLALFAAGTTFNVYIRHMEEKARRVIWPSINTSDLDRISGGRK